MVISHILFPQLDYLHTNGGDLVLSVYSTQSLNIWGWKQDPVLLKAVWFSLWDQSGFLSVAPQSDRWKEAAIVSLFTEHPPCAPCYCGIWEKYKSHWHKQLFERTDEHMEPHAALFGGRAGTAVLQPLYSTEMCPDNGPSTLEHKFIFRFVDWVIKS